MTSTTTPRLPHLRAAVRGRGPSPRPVPPPVRRPLGPYERGGPHATARERAAQRAEALQALGACPKTVSAAATSSTGRYGAWSWWEEGGVCHVSANGRLRATVVYGEGTTLPNREGAEARWQWGKTRWREWEARRAANRQEAIAALERGVVLTWRDGQRGGTLETPSGHRVSARGVAAHFDVAAPKVDWSLVDWPNVEEARKKAARAFAGRVQWRDAEWGDPHATARERAAQRARRNAEGRRPAAKTVYVKEARRKESLREVLAFC